MNPQIAKWNERYREGHDDLPVPLPFLVDHVSGLIPGRALDLACGTGRHAIWLAERGWQVLAIDGSDVAMDQLRARGVRHIETRVEDIEQPGWQIPADGYDLIVDTFFLHRPLFPQIRDRLKPAGIAVLACHAEGRFGIDPTELDRIFADWIKIHFLLHSDIPTVEAVFRKP